MEEEVLEWVKCWFILDVGGNVWLEIWCVFEVEDFGVEFIFEVCECEDCLCVELVVR